MRLLQLSVFFLCLITTNIFSQSTCGSAAAFCANNTSGTTFPAGTNTSAAAGPDYGCLFTQPNPAWYFFQASQSGSIIISISGTGGGDVDFVCWGPFNSQSAACSGLTSSCTPNCLSNVGNPGFYPSGNMVDCSYDISPTETCTINNAIVGEYYQLMITNFSGMAQNINFNQVGGTGSSNCSLIAPVTSATICSGQTASISANTSLTSPTFSWSPGGMTTQTITVSPASTTVYTVTVTGLDPSNTSTTVIGTGTVTVGPPSTITITPSLSSICLGQSVSLSSSGTGPFVWSASTGMAPSSAANVTVTPSSTTTYTVVSGVGTCTAQAIATVSISTTPSITITPSLSTICSGQSAVMSSSGSAPFTWTTSTGTNPASAATVTVTPTVTTTYTVLSGTGTCTATAVATVSIAPALTVNITPSVSTICSAQTATLICNGFGPNVWIANTGTNPTPTDTVFVSPTVTTTYTVLSGTGTCTSQAVATVSVLPVINPTIIASSSTVCITNTVSLMAASGSGLTYTWQPINAISGANNTSSIVAMPPSSTTVIYSVTVSNGYCSSNDTIQIKVKTPVDITNIITLNNDTICVGGCVTFSAVTTGSQPVFYQWYYQSGVGTSSVGIAPEACYPSAGSFSVVATASNTCGVDTMIKTNFITVFDMPVLVVNGDTTINIGESAEVFASGGISYLWSPNVNGNTIACITCSNTVVQPTLTTQYIVVASNSKYCKVQDTVTVIVDINCGDFFIPNVFSPNDDGLNDVINVHGRCISTFNLQIFNRWGEKVFETSTLENSWDGIFRGKKMDTGVFIYKADGVSIDGQSFKMQGNITLIR